ncbi:galactosidase [Lithospermum erythrorhizon]|uniref:Beta-galactosidase n=1 Tax=Lithospermum erythrorhizon TaxID=34254 RepID=A0AAV3NMB7_LITER
MKKYYRNLVLITLITFLIVLTIVQAKNKHKDKEATSKKIVTYDGRSLMVNGERVLLFSGSIHYPRSPPEMWPDILEKAKNGGLNVIQTYVFWNIHEPVQGKFNFEGNYDLVKFIKLIGQHGLYVTLRIGPYIEAEWNQGGFPYWLREVPNITFRSYNDQFMNHMKQYSERIIKMVEKEKLFAPQGGPIIMAQIENEYNNVQLAYRDLGKKYIYWAADMATSLYNGVPWIMCKQLDAPDKIINTCNGRQCADTFTGPNGPNKPSLWTENWTAQYRTFGDPPSQRSAEDIAFAVARFFAKNGTLTNYYMYYGGTNFGRTGSSFVTTRYYDEAPLDEFALQREPKWGHLRDLHKALDLSKTALLTGTQKVEKINNDLEITTYEKPGTKICAAFLTNNHSKEDFTINFRGNSYFMQQKSVSILPDCKTVVYNTQYIVAQHNARTFTQTLKARNFKWDVYQEKVPTIAKLKLKSKSPLELYSLTRDTSDYAWYSTSIEFDKRDLPMRSDIVPVLQIASLGHALVAFANGEYLGSGHGNNVEKSFVFRQPIHNLKAGKNEFTILAMTVGFPNSGAYMEKRFAGPRAVTIQGLMAGTLDITQNNWGHEVGISGERDQIYTKAGAKKIKWKSLSEMNGSKAVTWYKTHFDMPEGSDPLAINMNSMSKGMIWVNGKSIGRYWVSFLSPLGQSSQAEYHIPRAFLKDKNNLLVIFEENGGNITGVQIQTVNRDIICSIISEAFPPQLVRWGKPGVDMSSPVTTADKSGHLYCPQGKVVKAIEFASYGNPEGACGYFKLGSCTSPNSQQVAEQHCLGKSTCEIPLSAFEQKCEGFAKLMAIQARCGN